MAGVFANNGDKVLIIDTDHQGNALLSFGKNPDHYDYTLFDVLADGLPCERAIIDVHPNIDVLVSNDDMIGFDFEIIGNRDKYGEPFYLLRESCAHIVKQYDHVLIDSSPSMSLTIANIFSFPGVNVLIPMQCEQYSRRSLVKTLETIEDFRDKHNPSLNVLGIVPTLFDSRTNLHSEVLQDVRQYSAKLGVTVFDTVIPKSVRYASSVAYENLPVTLSDSTHKTSQVYNELAKELF